MPKKYVADPADATVVDEAEAPKKRGRPAKTEKIVKKAKKASKGRRGAELIPDNADNPAAKAVRTLRGKDTLQSFAEATGFNSAPAVSRLENSKYWGTSIGTLQRLAMKKKVKLVIKFV